MSEYNFADDIPWIKYKCLEIAKDVGKSPKQIIAHAREFEKYILPSAVKLKIKGGKDAIGKRKG